MNLLVKKTIHLSETEITSIRELHLNVWPNADNDMRSILGVFEDNPEWILCFQEEKLIGMGTFGKTSDNLIFIYNVCVNEDYRRLGVARKMFEKLKSHLKSFKAYGMCRPDNEEANAMYQKIATRREEVGGMYTYYYEC